MQRTLQTPLRAVLLLASASFATAQVNVFTAEDFDTYPVPGLLNNQTGGTGWINPWFVDNGNDVVNFDSSIQPNFALGMGPYAGQAVEFGGAYRMPDTSTVLPILDAGKIGADGATVWISFSTVTYQIFSPDRYNGLSLFNQGVGEVLFIGSPWQTGAWGIDDEAGMGAPPVVVPGSDDSVAERIVVRIDHMSGDERLRLWLSPTTAYPTTPADIDTMIVDLRWDEIRLSSGGSGSHGFWDDIQIGTGTPGGLGTNYCGPAVPNASGLSSTISLMGSATVADNNLSLVASNVTPNAFGFFITSQTQGFAQNPGGSAGNICLSGTIGRFQQQIQNSGATGTFSISANLTAFPTPSGTPRAVIAGETWNFQAWHRDLTMMGTATSNFTDGISLQFQ